MILDTIASSTKKRVEKSKRKAPLYDLISQIYCNGGIQRFNVRFCI